MLVSALEAPSRKQLTDLPVHRLRRRVACQCPAKGACLLKVLLDAGNFGCDGGGRPHIPPEACIAAGCRCSPGVILQRHARAQCSLSSSTNCTLLVAPYDF